MNEIGNPKLFIILSRRKDQYILSLGKNNQPETTERKESLMYVPVAGVLRENNWQVTVDQKPSKLWANSPGR